MSEATMTDIVQKILLQTLNDQTLHLSLELENSVSAETSLYDIDLYTVEIANRVKTELINLIKQKEALAAKGKKTFSNFTQPQSPVKSAAEQDWDNIRQMFTSDTKSLSPQTLEERLDKLSLKNLLECLRQHGLVQTGFLAEVYRFNNTPFSYTVTDTEWKSPFLTSGTTARELLKDLETRTHLYQGKTEQEFLQDILAQDLNTRNLKSCL